MANVNNEKYDPKFCKDLVEHMKMGLSYDSFPAYLYDKYDIMVGLSTMYDWEKRCPEWAEAKAIAVSKSLTFYEKRAVAKVSGQKIDGIDTKNIDSFVLMGMLKTRFHKIYGDKSKVEVDTTDEVKGALTLAYSLRGKKDA